MSGVEKRREGKCPGWTNDWREYVLSVKNDGREYVREGIFPYPRFCSRKVVVFCLKKMLLAF